MSPAITPLAANPPAIDTSATAFMIICAALVLLMTPGLALFYGGMTRAKSVLNMMMMSFGAMGVAGVVYVLWGYSMSFGGSDIGGIFANPFDKFGLRGVASTVEGVTGTVGADGMPVIDVFGADVFIPEVLFAGFQLTFAIITVALISGAIADRAKFSTWLVFCAIWLTVVYFPIAHMVWGGGLLSGAETSVASWLFGSTDGAATIAPIDFAGGTVVHINAGIAGLVLALVVGKRLGFGKTAMRPHNVPLVMIGAGLLWFGWFGFNAGSALVTNDGDTQLAAVAFLNTLLAGGAALLGWIGYEKLRHGASTTLGAASGIVAGLVAITPAAGFVTPLAAIPIGLVAGVLCATCLGLKERLGFDDSLDVVAVHLIGGLWGSLSVGLFATSSVNALVTDAGLFVGGGAKLLGVQAIAAVAALAFSFVGTFIIGKLVGLVMQNRVDVETEITGLDQAMHSETAYEFTSNSQGAHRSGPLGQGAASLPGAPAAETITVTKEEAR